MEHGGHVTQWVSRGTNAGITWLRLIHVLDVSGEGRPMEEFDAGMATLKGLIFACQLINSTREDVLFHWFSFLRSNRY